jgi:site-specific DNA recombinase
VSRSERRKRLDAYIRVSRVGGREGERYITKAQQREAIERWCGLQGYEVAEWFEEEDRSGGDSTRPKWKEAIGRALAAETDGVIVAKLDRFARSAIDGLKAVAQLEEAGRTFVSVAEKFDTADPYGRFTATIFFALAELELARIKDGWDDAWTRRIESGKHSSSRPPAGYSRGADGRLVPNEHAPAVRRAFELRADGASQAEIARHLISAGVPTASSRPAQSRWGLRAVKLLLENRVYLGEARFGAKVKKDAHPALVGPGLFRAVQDRKATLKAASKNGGEGPLLGGGLLRCDSCGGRLSLDTTKAGGRTYRFYRCKSNPACPARVSISARQIEPYLAGIVKRFLATAVYAPEAQPDALGSLRATVADAEEELRQLVESDEPIPASLLAARGNVLAARVAAAQEALEQAEAAQAVPVTFPSSAEAWEALPVPEQRKIISALLGRVVVRRGRGLPVWERIERPEAPDDWPQAQINEQRAEELSRRFAELYRELQAGGELLAEASPTTAPSDG